MSFSAGMNRRWYVKGLSAGRRGLGGGDYTKAWSSATGKPGDSPTSGKRIEAQESFYQGYNDGSSGSRNPSRPSRRVGKALRKYVNKTLGLPTQYTPAKVRVDSKGEIDIKFARPPKGKLKNPKRFKVNRKK